MSSAPTLPGSVPPPRRSRLRRASRAVLFVILGVASIVGLYFAVAEVGTRVAVNRDADPLAGSIDVYAVSNGVHVDLWLPAVTPGRDWTEWLPKDVPLESYGYVAFGWGDRGFYLEVPTWDDLTLGVALRALFLPSASAMHVTAFNGPPIEHEQVHLLRVTPERYADLVGFIDRGFRLDGAGRPELIDHPGYAGTDRFFVGRGSYHLGRTCNVWTNEAIAAMGQRAAWWAPFERSARFHLPKNRGVATPR